MDMTELQRLIGRPGMYYSPTDFTAAYATATTLTLGDIAGLPTVASLISANAPEVRGVLEIQATSNKHIWWSAKTNTPSFAAGTLTMNGVAFTAASQYIVVVSGPMKGSSTLVALLAMLTNIAEANPLTLLGLPGIYHSDEDFAATYNDPDEIDLTGLPTVPTSGDFLAVYEKLDGDVYKPWLATDLDFVFTPTGPGAGTLQVVTATFTATSEFIVVYKDQIKGFDPVLNSMQEVLMNAIQHDWIDVETPITAGNFATANPQDTGFFITKGLKWIGVEILWTALGADTITITPRTDNTDAGVLEHIWTRGDYLYPNGVIGGAVALDASGLTEAQAGAGTIYRYLRLAVHATNRMKIQFSSGLATGTITVRVTKQG